MVVVFYLLAALVILATRFVGKQWKFQYFLGGLIVGLFFEIYFEFCWDYNPNLKPYVWRDIPLIVLLGWGTFTQLALSLSDVLQRKLPSKNIKFSLDLLFVYLIFLMNEIVFSSLNFWTYNNDIHADFVARITGFCFLSLIVVSVSRKIDALVSKKII